MFSREYTDEGQQHFLFNTKPSLLKWLQSLLIVLNESTHCDGKWA
jgi:hypothetical protein